MQRCPNGDSDTSEPNRYPGCSSDTRPGQRGADLNLESVPSPKLHQRTDRGTGDYGRHDDYDDHFATRVVFV